MPLIPVGLEYRSGSTIAKFIYQLQYHNLASPLVKHMHTYVKTLLPYQLAN